MHQRFCVLHPENSDSSALVPVAQRHRNVFPWIPKAYFGVIRNKALDWSPEDPSSRPVVTHNNFIYKKKNGLQEGRK